MAFTIDPKIYGPAIKPESKKRYGNLQCLINIFATDSDPKIEDMPKKMSLTKAIKWLDPLMVQNDVDKKLMEQLNKEGRLVPEYCDLPWRKVYSRTQLLEYYLESKPR